MDSRGDQKRHSHNCAGRREARRTRKEVCFKQSIHLRPSQWKSNSRTRPAGRRARWQPSQNGQKTATAEETRKSLSAFRYSSSSVPFSCHLPYLARFQDFTLHYEVARHSESRCGANFVLRARRGYHLGYHGFGHRRESSALCATWERGSRFSATRGFYRYAECSEGRERCVDRSLWTRHTCGGNCGGRT